MNIEIEKLKEQATEDIMGVPVLNADLFAKLIVKECAKVAVFKDDGNVFSTADVAGARAAGRVIAANLIKDHFGVE